MRENIPSLKTLALAAHSSGDNALRIKYAAKLAAKLDAAAALDAKAEALKRWRNELRREREADRFEFLKSIGLKFIPEYGWSH